ncbi:hypothetical protein NS226_22770 [Aureimonas ureilytica]|uniref:DUF4194 domain-containing protein n=1 Tax=Aureimonas ureilytica TaxID=401562 RepID=A0A175QX45_9HYPH|nr:DUF4194 domain-containing protein [Aureimonas ureilytica]KTQ80648.1 hypothetical protein NS226_22770 [Aureimonas ureilytica]
MQRETDEFRDIVDGEWAGGHIAGRRPTGEELTRALQVMITRQCVYSHTPGIGRTYDMVRAYPTFFERYFGSLGYRLVISPRDQMVALSVPADEARYDGVFERLRKDETLVLLALRLLWEESLRAHEVGEAGIVDTTTDDLVDRLVTVTQSPPPEETRLLDILRMFARHGALRLGERDRVRRVSTLAILPGIAILVPDSYVRDLLLWAVEPAASGDGAALSAEEGEAERAEAQAPALSESAVEAANTNEKEGESDV